MVENKMPPDEHEKKLLFINDVLPEVPRNSVAWGMWHGPISNDMLMNYCMGIQHTASMDKTDRLGLYWGLSRGYLMRNMNDQAMEYLTRIMEEEPLWYEPAMALVKLFMRYQALEQARDIVIRLLDAANTPEIISELIEYQRIIG